MFNYKEFYQNKYGTIDEPKINEKDGKEITTFASIDTLTTIEKEQGSHFLQTTIFTTPINETSMKVTDDESILNNSTQVTVTREFDDYVSSIFRSKNRKVLIDYMSMEDYHHKKPSQKTIVETKQLNDLSPVIDIETTEKFSTNGKKYFVSTNKRYDETVSSLNKIIAMNSKEDKITRHFNEIVTIESTAETNCDVTPDNANLKTITTDIYFTTSSNPQKPIYKDLTFEEYWLTQNGDYVLNQSSRIVKNGEKEEFYIEDDTLIFASGEFLEMLKKEDIVDEEESINALNEYADKLSESTILDYNENNLENDSESIM